jgi:hypothetical protein
MVTEESLGLSGTRWLVGSSRLEPSPGTGIILHIRSSNTGQPIRDHRDLRANVFPSCPGALRWSQEEAKRDASPTISAFRVRRHAYTPIYAHTALVAPPHYVICGLFKFRNSSSALSDLVLYWNKIVLEFSLCQMQPRLHGP